MDNITCEEFMLRNDLLDYPDLYICNITDMPNKNDLLEIIGDDYFPFSNGSGNTIYIRGEIKLNELYSLMHDKSENRYIWGDLMANKNKDKILEMIPIIESDRETESFKVFMGNARTGSHVHHHSPAANYLLYGSKLWWLFPMTDHNKEIMKSIGFSNNMHFDITVKQWVSKHSKYLKENIEGLIITKQYAGQVLIIPNRFYHLIINLEPCMGVVYSWEQGGEYLNLTF